MDGRRRLPLWMLGVAAADQVGKSDNGDLNNINIEEGIVSPGREPKSKARSARDEKEVLLPDKEALEVEESSLLVKCETKRRKRKLSQQDASCDGNVCKAGIEKKKRGRVGRTVWVADPRKRRKTKSFGFESSEELEVPSPSEDDGDLTMEDLMSIANEVIHFSILMQEEYVKDDKDMGQQQSSGGERKAESQFPAVAFSRNESRGSLNATQSNKSLPTHRETTSCCNSAENSTSGGIVVNPRMTGDPSQDMLDLFLGPLLKKPLEGEKKAELITEDMTFAYELKKQNQNVVLGEELVPLTKKKSSLKDKDRLRGALFFFLQWYDFGRSQCIAAIILLGV